MSSREERRAARAERQAKRRAERGPRKARGNLYSTQMKALSTDFLTEH
jgi:hypothetical protein|eukprot:COSAG02_NODE_7430_length_3017_cov_16.257711_1_plen_48_part_00